MAMPPGTRRSSRQVHGGRRRARSAKPATSSDGRTRDGQARRERSAAARAITRASPAPSSGARTVDVTVAREAAAGQPRLHRVARRERGSVLQRRGRAASVTIA